MQSLNCVQQITAWKLKTPIIIIVIIIIVVVVVVVVCNNRDCRSGRSVLRLLVSQLARLLIGFFKGRDKAKCRYGATMGGETGASAARAGHSRPSTPGSH